MCGHTELGAASLVPSWPFIWLPNSRLPHHLLQDGFRFSLPSPSCSLGVPCPLMSRFGLPLARTPVKPGSILSPTDLHRAPTQCKAIAGDQSSEGRAWSPSRGQRIGCSHRYLDRQGKDSHRDSKPPPGAKGASLAPGSGGTDVGGATKEAHPH